MDGYHTPRYSISQDDTSVSVHIVVPFHHTSTATSAPTARLAIAQRIFAFLSGSYYLPLVFPHSLIEPTQKDLTPIHPRSNQLEYLVRVQKEQNGSWQGLEQLRPQLMPEDESQAMLRDAANGTGPFNQHSEHPSDALAESLLRSGMQKAGLVDLDAPAPPPVPCHSFPQVVPPSTATNHEPPKSSSPEYAYGITSHPFTGPWLLPQQTDTRNILETRQPASLSPQQRHLHAEAWEDAHWDEGIYLDTFLDPDGQLDSLLSFPLPLPSPPPAPTTRADDPGSSQLPRDTASLLVQLIFAHTYELQTTFAEPTVESCWTIAKLSRTLSSFSFPTHSAAPGILATLRALMRRALVVPLYRHWDLALLCLRTTVTVLQRGRSAVLPAIREIARLFADDPIGTDVWSRLDQVFLSPLLAVLEGLPNDAPLTILAKEVDEALQSGELTKSFVGGEQWDIEVSEQVALEAVQDGQGGYV